MIAACLLCAAALGPLLRCFCPVFAPFLGLSLLSCPPGRAPLCTPLLTGLFCGRLCCLCGLFCATPHPFLGSPRCCSSAAVAEFPPAANLQKEVQLFGPRVGFQVLGANLVFASSRRLPLPTTFAVSSWPSPFWVAVFIWGVVAVIVIPRVRAGV